MTNVMPPVDAVKQQSARIEMLEQRTREAMRLVAPVYDRMPQLYPTLVHSSDQYFAIKHCPICTPPPKTYKCPICDLEVDEKWKMQVHVANGYTGYCKRRLDAKRKAWAKRVNLDA